MALCGERTLVIRSDRVGPRGERRPQKHRRLCVLSEAQKRASQVIGGGQRRAGVWSQHPSVDAQLAGSPAPLSLK